MEMLLLKFSLIMKNFFLKLQKLHQLLFVVDVFLLKKHKLLKAYKNIQNKEYVQLEMV